MIIAISLPPLRATYYAAIFLRHAVDAASFCCCYAVTTPTPFSPLRFHFIAAISPLSMPLLRHYFSYAIFTAAIFSPLSPPPMMLSSPILFSISAFHFHYFADYAFITPFSAIRHC